MIKKAIIPLVLLIAVVLFFVIKPKAIPEHKSMSVHYPTHEYKPLDSLEPFGWLPDFAVAFNPFNLALGVTVYAADYSLKHNYSLSAGYDFTYNRYFASLNYSYFDIFSFGVFGFG